MEPSSRNLVSGGLGTTLRDFRGTLAEYITEEKDIQNTTRKAVSVILRYKDVEVIKSTEPYVLPTAEIRIPLSQSANSRWGIVGTSANKIQADTEDFPKDHINKQIRMTVSAHKMWNGRTNKEEDTEAWEVTEIAGKTAGQAAENPVETLSKLLDGKTLAGFNAVALGHAIVKASANVQKSIIDKSFVEGLVVAGKFTCDANGVYHKV